MSAHILAVDQGTTGTTALVMTRDGQTVGRAGCEFPQHFPRSGWVEHEPEEIWQSTLEAVEGAVRTAGIDPASVVALGITNQRETTLVWERATGRPVARAIVWQDRRTAARCQELREEGREPRIRELSGLVLDPYFSATKLCWILDSTPGLRARAEAGELCFGTVDSYLIWRLSGGAEGGQHLTDATNASRTLLMDLESCSWSSELCDLFRIPHQVLPQIRDSAGQFGRTRGMGPLPDGVPITGVAGDQHAALFGQGCFEPGDAKCTYGTGAFVVMNTGDRPVPSSSGLLSTLAWRIGGRSVYALEGACFVAGAAVQWLRDGLGLVGSAAEIEQLARQVSTSEGVVFVPALTGLGAPHWDPNARGLICGLTRGTGRAHIARATLEAIALQVDDLLIAMRKDSSRGLERLAVDGGAAANDLLMQLQADLSALAVDRPQELESTARGAAMLAGIGAGLFSGPEDARGMIQLDRRFSVSMNEAERSAFRSAWSNAVNKARSTTGKN